MKSIVLHKWERRTQITVISLFLFCCIAWLAKNQIPLNQQMIIYLIETAYLICFGMIFTLYLKFRKWKREGYEFSRKLGLKRILIFPTEKPLVYELHHN
ncbi:MAG: hypothetical protein Q8934_23630, partial [Bacillota bacterium]|nr:hypothetical protein [Bacillota bacterium]